MKKIFIGVLLILMAALLIFQHIQSNRPNKNASVVKQNQNIEEGGVSLPKEASEMANIISNRQNIPQQQIPADNKNQPVPEHIAGCVRNSVPDILQDHGTVWGDSPKGYQNPRKYVFTPDEVLRIKDLLSRYYACKAVAVRNNYICSELPNTSSDGKSFTPKDYCNDYYNMVSFTGFMAGRIKEDASCRDFLTGDRMRGAPKLNPDIFCKAASKGLPDLCESMKGQGMDNMRELCHSRFPSKASDCDKSWPTCLKLDALYKGINKSDPSLCPPEYEEMCSALISGGDGVCTKLKDKLVITYCDIYKRVQTAQDDWLKKESEREKMAAKKKSAKNVKETE